MGYGLKGGRPKNMKQGVYWVQRHRDDLRRGQGNRPSYTPQSDEKTRPDAWGWVFIIVISIIIIAIIS